MPGLVVFTEPCLVVFTGIFVVVGICLFVDRLFDIVSLNDDFFSTIEVGVVFFSSLI